MKYTMGLNDEYFKQMKEGNKLYEVRLNDEKRRKLAIGDIIDFVKLPEQVETLKMEVTKLKRFPTFKAMYSDIPFVELGCEGWTRKEMLKGTYEIYSHKQEKEWGTLAIGVKKLH